MDSAVSKERSLILSPFSSPTAGELLRRKIQAWTQESGSPVSTHVRVSDRIFDLHEPPLLLKSGYFKRALAGSKACELPDEFPGGSDIFEMVVLFIYGSSSLIDPFNVAALRCAAEFLEMTEDHCSCNLCERADLYLNQVVLQSWDDTLIVLQKCQMLLPWAEDLLIVGRCVESLAFMSCMEILDPEQRRDRPVVTLHSLVGRAWDCKTAMEIAGLDLWIKDLIALPFEFFKRIIASLRRQGMKEKYVGPMIAFYATKWVLSKKTHQFWENAADEKGAHDASNKISVILQGIVDLLPISEKATKVIPVGFYFALLSRSLDLGLSNKSNMKLQDQIVSMLHLARVDDFLLPENGMGSTASSMELETMERIVSIRVSSDAEVGHTPLGSISVVAELWDGYLRRIALDPNLAPRRFMELIEIVPISDRQTHNNLYRAVATFLKEHPDITHEEKSSVCKYLNCQKLSQETCIEAVQNELMPLRLIVQALFVQQLNTHQAFKDCSESFRYTHCSEPSGSLSSSRYQLPKSQNLGESPCKQGNQEGETVNMPLGYLIQKDLPLQSSELDKDDLESTSFRIQSLEQELMSLKRTLQQQSTSKGSQQFPGKTKSFRISGLEARSASKKGKPLSQTSSCIGSVNWATQRRYVGRILKIFRKMALFGRGKSKRKQVASGLSDGPSPCNRTQDMHEMYGC
ncbi:BTB/POZ domain-containing protein At5g48130 [Magnolia sinica]|uniref:BTB/POZ domain-containing protein At5g48130 n=1 Tax=Magnolia sinica TaxID=86752 RepID=UPI00265A75A2|nr:BTB/POZ domain-containing protein At5g48130 [Magnolia sinica]XP_058070708.1 BTB/POZ domain-containing protein At5g48130 [Magnolia sinica]